MSSELNSRELPPHRPADLLLAIRLLDEPSRSYSPPFELVWPTGNGAPPSNLYSLVEQRLATSQPFRLAKRTANRRSCWLPLPHDDVGASPQPLEARRRAANQKAISLLRAPYGLRDGDVIGLKVSEIYFLSLIILIVACYCLGEISRMKILV